jgi:Domain of unknown function (DUF4123)
MKCTQILALLDASNDLLTYSLVDGAQALGIGAALQCNEEVEIYPLLGKSDVTLVGPILVFHKRGTSCATLAHMAEADSSSLYLSILQARGDTSLLVAHLAALAHVSHVDGSQWVMRYYDPRILAHWSSVLDSEQYTFAFSRVAVWYYIDADCMLGAIKGGGRTSGSYEPKHQLRFSEMQSSDLLDKCAPFMLLNIISQDRGVDIWRRDECERYKFVRRVLAHALGLGITEFSDQKTFVLLALAYGESFHESQAFQEAWSSEGGNGLNAIILQMPPEAFDRFGL